MLSTHLLQQILLVIWLFICHFSEAAVRRYNFTISRGTIEPDGVRKLALLVNNQFPGPSIVADWNDTIVVTVQNRITGPEEGTSLHWHGLFQKGTPWADGVPAVNQCPIPPGHSYTYTFLADQYGTSWYHSHYSAQYTDGALGPVVIRGPQNVEYDIDLGPVVLTDWFRTNYTTAIGNLLSKPPVPPRSINTLINGKSFANYNDTLTKPFDLNPKNISTFSFQHGKTHLLRFINAGAEGFQHVSIDSHQMTVVAVDFTPIQPYNATVISLGAGQRMDVLVRALASANSSHWLRANMSTVCSLVDQPYGLAAIYYPSSNRSKVPQSTAQPYNETGSCLGPSIESTIPRIPTKPITLNPATKSVDVRLGLNASGFSRFYMDNVTFVGNYSSPILSTAYSRDDSTSKFDPRWNVFDFGDASAIRLIVTNSEIFPHPLHLHGHAFWVLAEGRGKWDGRITNPNNPARRDTHIIGTGTPESPAYVVIQFEADNPGVWPFHCHAAWHLAIGMMSNILEKASSLRGRIIAPQARQLCRAWETYQARSGAGDTEEGLRRLF